MRDGPGVLGIDVDRRGGERVQHDRGVAQSLAVRRGGFAGGKRRLLDDLAEDVRLGEALGADVQLGRRHGCSTDPRENRAREQDLQILDRHVSPRGDFRVTLHYPAQRLPVELRLEEGPQRSANACLVACRELAKLPTDKSMVEREDLEAHE